jgi:arylsulfatase
LVLSAGRAAERPNVIIILTDDMGFSDLGCFGGEIATPNLDKLATGGLRFTEFYNTARCWLTRATLLSGRYSDQLTASQVTIAEVLKGAGYETGMVGKWHLGMDPKKNGPIQRGFDDFYGTMTGAGSFYDPYTLARNTEFIEAQGEDYYYTDVIGSEAVRQIESFAKSDKPFFQYVAFTAAHWPIHAPEKSIQKYLKLYESGWEKLRNNRYARMLEMGIIDKQRWPLPPLESRVQPWDTIDHKPWRIRNMAIYAAMVDHMDQAVGKIVGALQQTRQIDNTLIVYFHDNGACPEHLSGNGWNTANNILAKAKASRKTIAVGDKYDVPMGGPDTYGSVGHNWACAQNTPMRRYKMNVHNGGACTPAIMHWPAGIKTESGSITSQRGHVIDMMATCIDLAGAQYPKESGSEKIEPHESISLAPIFRRESVDRDHAYLFNHAGTHAVVKGDFKIVREGRRPWALYNLAKNRTETINLAKQSPGRVKELAEHWYARYGRPKWDVERQGNSEPAQSLKWISVGAARAPKSRSGVGTAVIFQNKSELLVKVYWVDPGGKRKPYGELKPGATRRQNTYSNATWLITDQNDKPLGHFIAGGYEARAVIPEGTK